MIAVILLGMNWRLALVALAIIPLLLWVIRAYGNSMTGAVAAGALADSELTTGAAVGARCR